MKRDRYGEVVDESAEEPMPALTACLRHPSRPALRHGFCRACCADVPEVELMAEAQLLAEGATR